MSARCRGPGVNVALIQLSRQTRGRHEVVVVVEDGKFRDARRTKRANLISDATSPFRQHLPAPLTQQVCRQRTRETRDRT
jgi:hypothetical protein